jgi:hypothetical protein
VELARFIQQVNNMANALIISVYNSNKKTWTEYVSMAKAAAGLYVSSETLKRYFAGQTQKSSLDVYKIKINGVLFNHEKTRNEFLKKKIKLYQHQLKRKEN